MDRVGFEPTTSAAAFLIPPIFYLKGSSRYTKDDSDDCSLTYTRVSLQSECGALVRTGEAPYTPLLYGKSLWQTILLYAYKKGHLAGHLIKA
jgi:hypothetical protein